jgi:hypothetical protein
MLMAATIEEWSNKEARRIARIALCVPEPLRGEYIARKMVEAIQARADEQLDNWSREPLA